MLQVQLYHCLRIVTDTKLYIICVNCHHNI